MCGAALSGVVLCNRLYTYTCASELLHSVCVEGVCLFDACVFLSFVACVG